MRGKEREKLIEDSSSPNVSVFSALVTWIWDVFLSSNANTRLRKVDNYRNKMRLHILKWVYKLYKLFLINSFKNELYHYNHNWINNPRIHIYSQFSFIQCSISMNKKIISDFFPRVPWSEVKWSEVSQSCPTFCDPMDCSLPGSSVYGIFQARVLEWVAISFSRGSSWPRDRTRISRIVGRCFTVWATSILACIKYCNIRGAVHLKTRVPHASCIFYVYCR